MITFEKLDFTKESIISIVINKEVILEERFRYYPEYKFSVFGVIKNTKKNYLRDLEFNENKCYKNSLKPGELIKLPGTIFYSGINNGMIGEDMYPDGSYKVYKIPYIIIKYKNIFNQIDMKEYTFKTEKEINKFIELLYEKGLLTDDDLFYDRVSSKLVKNIKL